MALTVKYKKSDKTGYEDLYGKDESISKLEITSRDSYIEYFKKTNISPFYAGGTYKGYVKRLAVEELLKHADARNIPRSEITILDAACGVGHLSVYLACLGFNVIGVDLSEQGCLRARQLADKAGVSATCAFLEESLESMAIEKASIDFIVGSAALHHFIKYEGVPGEFKRVMKPGAMGFFTDSYSENPIYRVFHDVEKMDRLGDVLLSQALIEKFFYAYDVQLRPTDWFVMLDKLYVKVFPRKFKPILRKASRLHYWLDRKMPYRSRVTLWLSGAILTTIVSSE